MGIRQVVTDNNEFETWTEIAKLNESSYQLTNIAISSSPATKWAVIISITISLLMAAFLIIGVVYGVNAVYSQIITQVSQTTKYNKIDKKDDAGSE